MTIRSGLHHKMWFWEANEMLSMLFGSGRKNGTEMTWLVVIKNLLEFPVLNFLIPLATQGKQPQFIPVYDDEILLVRNIRMDTLKSFDCYFYWYFQHLSAFISFIKEIVLPRKCPARSIYPSKCILHLGAFGIHFSIKVNLIHCQHVQLFRP